MNKTKGWKAPVYRKSYKKRYGPGCFLKPKTQKYPICKEKHQSGLCNKSVPN